LRKESKIGKVTIVDKATGELFDVPIATSVKYYSIKKMNFKGNIMSIMEKQAYICKGAKDIMAFWWILNKSKDNIFERPTEIASEIGADYDKRIAPLIKRGIECGMWKRTGRGKYLINPYVFLSKGTSNAIAELLQKNHPTWELDEKYAQWLEKMKGRKDD